MKIDILIEYNEKLSCVTISSKTAQFSLTRESNIGLSHPLDGNSGDEYIEFIGEDFKDAMLIREEFYKEPSRKGYVLRVIDPFEPTTFESYAAYKMTEYASIKALAMLYPRTWSWRFKIPWLTTYDLTLKVPGYNFFNPQKKAQFEKLLRKKFKNISFVSQ